jgi:hypothetical protein
MAMRKTGITGYRFQSCKTWRGVRVTNHYINRSLRSLKRAPQGRRGELPA